MVPALRWTDLWEDVVARPTDDVLRYPADDALRGRNCVWQHSLDLQDRECMQCRAGRDCVRQQHPAEPGRPCWGPTPMQLEHTLALPRPCVRAAERLHFIFKPDMYAHLLGQHVK